MKKLFFIIVAGVLFYGCGSDGSGSSGGDDSGSSSPPVEISTVAELQAIQNNLTGDYILINDIDLQGVNFQPIGFTDSEVTTIAEFVSGAFRGSFDGHGYIISNLTLDMADASYVGLFGRTYQATIINIHLENVDITGGSFVGSLVGSNDGTINNSTSSGRVYGQDFVGGFVGSNDGTINDSTSSGRVYGQEVVGGFVGLNLGVLKMESNSFSGTVNGNVGNFYGHNGAISTARELQAIQDDLSNNYALINDIDLQGVNFQPIGTQENSFHGTFYGNGYKISNLTINLPTSDNVGLFGYISSAYITNVTLEKVNITGANNVGSFVGYNSRGTIENSTYCQQDSLLEAVGYNDGTVDIEVKDANCQ